MDGRQGDGVPGGEERDGPAPAAPDSQPRRLDAQAEDALQHERERRRLSELREGRGWHFARAVAAGAAAGAIAVLFQWALFFAESLRSEAVVRLRQYPAWGWLVLPAAAACAAGAAGWMTARFAPEASGSGIPHVKAVLLRLRPFSWVRVLPVKFVAGVLAIGSGLSLGREGPTVQMGAAAGQMMGRVLRAPARSRAHMVASGAGAGLAAAFNAPLAGFLFVLEELRREFSPITYGTALISTLAAVIVSRSFTGQLPSFHVRGYPAPPLAALPLAAMLGVLCGLLGVLFNRGILAGVRAAQSWGVASWARAAVVGAGAGLIAWWLPEAVGGGHRTAEHVLRGEITGLTFILVLLAVKFALTLASYATSVPGGIFAPLLTLGALLGLAVGSLGARWVPAIAGAPAAFAVLGMAGMFTASVRAPLTGIVLILEMTANYEQLLAVAVACLAAYVVADALHDKPIYEALLEYDLHRSEPGPLAADEPILVDVAVEPHSRMDGERVRDLHLPPGCLLVTLGRAGRETVPGGETRLRAGDHLVVIVAGDALRHVAAVKDAARSQA